MSIAELIVTVGKEKNFQSFCGASRHWHISNIDQHISS